MLRESHLFQVIEPRTRPHLTPNKDSRYGEWRLTPELWCQFKRRYVRRSQPGVKVGHLVGLDVGTDDLHLKKEGPQRVDCPGSILNLVTQADAVVKTFQLEKNCKSLNNSFIMRVWVISWWLSDYKRVFICALMSVFYSIPFWLIGKRWAMRDGLSGW